ERADILSALSELADPEDIIPDNVPVLGYIDDAIMIELVVKELRHEIDAFEDFSRFRAGELARKRDDKVSREDYLDHKRRDLQQRMRRRRSTMRRASKGTTRPRFRLF
ncbi:MAG: YkvA family protein, partial [Gammaproteobacteria bacterium]|nr:YkvA family protein [Gammaproteobacteria bacterium]